MAVVVVVVDKKYCIGKIGKDEQWDGWLFI
jgi:hypothetical protein